MFVKVLSFMNLFKGQDCLVFVKFEFRELFKGQDYFVFVKV